MILPIPAVVPIALPGGAHAAPFSVAGSPLPDKFAQRCQLRPESRTPSPPPEYPDRRIRDELPNQRRVRPITGTHTGKALASLVI
jgi:hypothetical protein